MPDTIKIGRGVQQYKPYHWIEKGQVVGIVSDLVRAVFFQIGAKKIKFISLPWKRLLRSAKIGELDAIISVYMTNNRGEYLDFASEPLAVETLSFFTKKKFNILYNGNFKQLSAYDVGTIRNYSYGTLFDEQNFNRISLNNEETLFKMFKAERFKVGISDTRVLAYYAKKIGFQYQLLKPTVAKETLHIAFPKLKQTKALSSIFSQSLAHFKMTPEYVQLLKKYGLEKI